MGRAQHAERGELLRENEIPRKCLAIALINPVVSEPPGIPQTAWPGLRRSVWACQVLGSLASDTAPNVKWVSISKISGVKEAKLRRTCMRLNSHQEASRHSGSH